jgi:hypothetical protein
MICLAKPVLTEDLCVVQKEEFSITSYKCDTYTRQKGKHKSKPIFSSGMLLHNDYDRHSSVEKISGRDPQGAWSQDELIGGKPPVVKQLRLRL